MRGIVFVWCVAAWRAYGRHNNASCVSTLARLLIVIVALPPLALIAIIIRGRTVVPQVGGDYEGVYERLSLIGSLGLYP